MNNDFLDQLNEEFGLHLSDGELAAIANACGNGKGYAEEQDVRQVVRQIAEDKALAEKLNIEESVLDWYDVNAHGKELEQELEDYLYDD